MDFVLLGICLFYFFKGYFKGFVSMLFSILGTFFVFIIAWKLSENCFQYLQNISFFSKDIPNFLENALNSTFPGVFSSMEEFQSFVMQSKYGFIFGTIIKLLIGDISFDGNLSAGQILSPSLSIFVSKIVCFIILFLILFLLLKFTKFLLNKVVKGLGFGYGNKWLGGLLGLVKGVIIFGIFYIILSAFANFLMNESLLNFVQSGNVSSFLYNHLINKIISLFY